jgi:membrane-bound serine protease (ClpP class)
MLPGIVGGICLILAAIAFQILPFAGVGLLVMLLGMGLLVAEIFFTSYGVLFAAGLVCFLYGGSMIFDVPEIGGLTVSFWSVLAPAVGGFAVFAGLVIWAIGRTFRTAQTAGVSELVGMIGRADSALDPEGRVFVRGEYWNARADETILAEADVEVLAVEGMRLRVRRSRAIH